MLFQASFVSKTEFAGLKQYFDGLPAWYAQQSQRLCKAAQSVNRPRPRSLPRFAPAVADPSLANGLS
jgi:hypothetical protein